MQIDITIKLEKTLTTGADVIAAISRSINAYAADHHGTHADLAVGQTGDIQDITGKTVGTWSVVEKHELIKIVAFASGGLVNSALASAEVDMDVVDYDEWECTRFAANETPIYHNPECKEHTKAEYDAFKLRLAKVLLLSETVF